MFYSILIALLLGLLFGCITGLIPGVHVNLISLILLSLSAYFLGFTSAMVLSVFIISMAVTHTFLDAIPSIFLGAPDADMALGVLPGHKLLLEGRGYEAVKLTVIGSLLALIVTIIIIPFLIPFVPKIYEFVKPFMGWILLAVVVYMILIEKGFSKKFWGLVIFLLSGVLGVLVLNWSNLSQPLFPMLSGLFGLSTLFISLNQNSKIPKQKVSEKIVVPKGKVSKAIGAAVFSGSLTGIFPGLGSAQAAVLSLPLVGEIGQHAFMILIGGINTTNFVFSLATFFAIQKARNGAVVVVSELIKSIGIKELVVFLCAALIAGSIATFLALKISKAAAGLITKINYRKLVIGIISFITVLTFVFSGFFGFMVLVVSSALGIVAPLVGVKRSHSMGCLMLPVILFFIL